MIRLGGREARGPRHIPGFRSGLRGTWEYLREVYDQAAFDNIFFLASGLTFSLLLAAVPFLLLVLSLAGLALAPRVEAPESAALDWIAQLLPVAEGTVGEVRPYLADLAESSGSLGLISAVLFVWFSTRLFGALRTVLDAVFDFRQGPGIIMGKILDIKMVVLATVLLTANIAITTALITLSREMLEQLDVPVAQTLRVAGLLAAWGAIFLMFLLIYKFVPSTRLGWRVAGVAALFSAVGFELVKTALGWYLSDVADFSRVFFAFATLVVTVVAFYYAAVVFVLGGEVAKVFGLRRVMHRQRELFDQT